MASGGNPEEVKKTGDKKKITKVPPMSVAKVTRPSRHDDKRRPSSGNSGAEKIVKTETNIYIRSGVQYMQVGNNNNMTINNFYGANRRATHPNTRQQIKSANCPKSSNELTESERENLQKLKDSKQRLTPEIMMSVSKIMGRRYRRYGRILGFSDAELEDIHHSRSEFGSCEVMYTVLREWTKKSSNPTLGSLVQELSEGEDVALIKDILKQLEISGILI